MFLSFAETFKALSDPVRREILELLKRAECLPERSQVILIWRRRLSPIIWRFWKSRSYQGNTGEKFYFLWAEPYRIRGDYGMDLRLERRKRDMKNIKPQSLLQLWSHYFLLWSDYFFGTNFPIHWQHIGEATEPQTDGPAKHFLSSECRSSWLRSTFCAFLSLWMTRRKRISTRSLWRLFSGSFLWFLFWLTVRLIWSL